LTDARGVIKPVAPHSGKMIQVRRFRRLKRGLIIQLPTRPVSKTVQ